MKSVLIFQMVYHPYQNALWNTLNMDFTNLRIDIMYALYDSIEGSKIHNPEEYFKHLKTVKIENKTNAQLEKSQFAKRLCKSNNYDYVFFVSDDVLLPKDTLQKIIRN